MRDALSLLEQVYSFKGTQISDEDVLFVLGATQVDLLIDLVACFSNQDAAGLSAQLQSIFDAGVSVYQVNRDLIFLFEQLLYLKLSLTERVELDDTGVKRLRVLVENFSLSQIQKFLEVLASLEMDFRWFLKPELLLQIRLLGCFSDQEKRDDSVVISEVNVSQRTPSDDVLSAVPKPSAVSDSSLDKGKSLSVDIKKDDREAHDMGAEVDASDPLWQQVVLQLKQERTALYAVLKESTLVSIQQDCLQISLKQNLSFFRQKLAEEAHVQLIDSLILSVFNRPLTFKVLSSKNAEGDEKSNSKNDDEKTVGLNQIVDYFEGTVLV
tara:strand:- start:160 stop:1134 length:975 start_codon:yes stop_codon:yes gene_type:complete